MNTRYNRLLFIADSTHGFIVKNKKNIYSLLNTYIKNNGFLITRNLQHTSVMLVVYLRII